MAGRTAIASTAGGTASALGGGKFANGAVTGAFHHLLNAEGGSLYDRISGDGEVDEKSAIGGQMRGDLDAAAPEMRAAAAETGFIMASIIPLGRALSMAGSFVGGIGSRIGQFVGIGGKVAPAQLVAKTGGEMMRRVASMAGSPSEKAAAIAAGAQELGLTFTQVSNVSGGWFVFIGKTPQMGSAPLLAIHPATGQLFSSQVGASALSTTGASGTSYLRAEFLQLLK